MNGIVHPFTGALHEQDGNGNILGYDYTNVLLDNYRPSVAPPAADSNDPMNPPALRLAITHYHAGRAVLDGAAPPFVVVPHVSIGSVR